MSDHYFSSAQNTPPHYLCRSSCLNYLFRLSHEDIIIDQLTIITAVQYLDQCVITYSVNYSQELAVACLAISYKVHQENTLDTRYQANILGNCLVHKYQQLLISLNLRPANFYSYLYRLYPYGVSPSAINFLHPEFNYLTEIICHSLLQVNPLSIIGACILITKYYPHKYKPRYLYRLYKFIGLLHEVCEEISHLEINKAYSLVIGEIKNIKA